MGLFSRKRPEVREDQVTEIAPLTSPQKATVEFSDTHLGSFIQEEYSSALSAVEVTPPGVLSHELLGDFGLKLVTDGEAVLYYDKDGFRLADSYSIEPVNETGSKVTYTVDIRELSSIRTIRNISHSESIAHIRRVGSHKGNYAGNSAASIETYCKVWTALKREALASHGSILEVSPNLGSDKTDQLAHRLSELRGGLQLVPSSARQPSGVTGAQQSFSISHLTQRIQTNVLELIDRLEKGIARAYGVVLDANKEDTRREILFLITPTLKRLSEQVSRVVEERVEIQIPNSMRVDQDIRQLGQLASAGFSPEQAMEILSMKAISEPAVPSDD